MHKILLSKEDIDKKVSELALITKTELIDKMQMALPIFLCVLDGGFRFFSDLISKIEYPILCDFIKISSYNKMEQSDIKVHKFPKYPIRGNDIIIIDDIYDTGNTIGYLLKELNLRNPKSISIITLLHRKSKPIITDYPYYTGFQITDEWVAGYGLDDFEGSSRNLNYIYELDKV